MQQLIIYMSGVQLPNYEPMFPFFNYMKMEILVSMKILKHILGRIFSRKKDTITIYNLMNHNAGWEEYGINSMALVDEAPNLTEYIHYIEPHQFAKPGEHVAY